jgi:hypothetical protein
VVRVLRQKEVVPGVGAASELVPVGYQLAQALAPVLPVALQHALVVAAPDPFEIVPQLKIKVYTGAG